MCLKDVKRLVKTSVMNPLFSEPNVPCSSEEVFVLFSGVTQDGLPGIKLSRV